MIRSLKVKKSKPIDDKGVLLRRAEKHNVKRHRLTSTKRFFADLFKSRAKQGFLKYRAYLCFITLLQMPLHYIMSLFDIVLRHGAALVLFVYIVLLIGVGLPLFMLFVFMGNYCRKGYMKYWQCIPLLKGAGYTIAIMIITPEFINSTSAGLSLLYISEMFTPEIPWTQCVFERVTNSCLKPITLQSKTTVAKTLDCTLFNHENIPTFSALNYLRFNKQNVYPHLYFKELGPIKWDWARSVIIVWLILFIFMVQGFLHFQRIMSVLQIFTILVWIIAFFSSAMIGHIHKQADSLFYGMHPILRVDFWLQIFIHICDRVEPGNIILLSSLRLTVSPPIIEAFIVYGIKLVMVILLIVWVPILLQNILKHYNIDDKRCLPVTGFEIVFAVIPDVLSTFPLPQAWIIVWFVAIFMHSFSSVLYTYTGFVDSLIEAWPKLLIYRIHICVLLCMLSIGINMLFVTRLGMVLLYTWTHYGMVVLRTIVLVLVTFALTFIYSLAHLINDYHFAYGEPPTRFWVQSWKVTPFLVLFETAFMMYQHDQSKQIRRTTSMLKFLSYLTAVLMLLPIFSVMLWKYCKHVKQRMVSSIIRPEPGWGYYNVLKRAARNHFNPQREVRYRTNKVKCKHNCLINSKKLKRLHQTQNLKKNSIATFMRTSFIDEESFIINIINPKQE